MGKLIGPVIAICAFLTIYEGLRRREHRRSGIKPPVQWGWLMACIGVVVFVLVFGSVLK